MLATGLPKHLSEWQEYHTLEPFGEDWKRTSLSTARIINAIISAIPTDGSEEKEYHEDDDFIPKREETIRQSVAISAQCAAADAMEGLGV